MTYLIQKDYVQYMCSCGSLKSIAKIYFCRHCLSIRCGYCLCHEVDSFYCPICLENPPPTEVRLKKNKCPNCLECPCCFQTLTIRAGQVLIKTEQSTSEEEVKPATKKVYYLICSSCRWSSRDAGIPDQAVATGSWPEAENPNAIRISFLIGYYKILASREKQQKEKQKFNQSKRFLQFEKFGITSAIARKRAGRGGDPQPQSQSSDQPPAAIASEDVDELPLEMFTEALDIKKVTTIEQRLRNPELQAESIHELRPQRKQFVVKRSQRCRTCEHNVSKPDYGPSSIKFKIQLSAIFHIPEVRIVSCEPLKVGKSSELLLKFCNPTQHQTMIMLLPSDTSMIATTTVHGIKEELTRENVQMGCDSPNLLPAAVRQTSVIEEPVKVQLKENADVGLPNSALTLPPKDDAAEYDDPSDSHNFQDDPNFVVWRKGNKAVVKLKVLPHVDLTTKEDEETPVIISFVMQFGYVNTIATIEHKKPQKLELKAKLFLTVGNLSAAD